MMIVARVEGGLGNQMFIYAYARALALQSGHKLALDIYNSGFEGADPFNRSYRLKYFPIAASLAASNEVKKFDHRKKNYYFLRKLSRFLPFGWKPIIQEPRRFNRNWTQFKPLNNAYIIGYWQDERYFNVFESEISTELSPESLDVEIDPVDLEEVQSPGAVVLHVRRVNFPKKLQSSYYAEALRRLINDRSHQKIIVFGDDPEWISASLGPSYTVKCISKTGPRRDLYDFYLMSRAKSLVISNSTFSWWAGWFAQRGGARVIAPEVWGYPARPSRKWELINAHLCAFEN